MKSILDIFKEDKKDEEIEIDRNAEWLDLTYKEQEKLCSKCKGLGWLEVEEIDKRRGVAIVDYKTIPKENNKYEYAEVLKQKCDCTLRKEATQSFIHRIKASGLEDFIHTKTFKNFEVTEQHQKEMLELCKNFAKEPKGTLALLGETGSGKTHLGTATVLNLVYKGYSAYYVEWKNEWNLAQNNYQTIDDEKMEKWKSADVLYIDDLFWTKSNDVNAISNREFEHGWQLLDARLKRNKITIISSEFTVQDFMEIDHSTAGRLVEMAGDNLFVIEKEEGVNKNYRLKDVI